MMLRCLWTWVRATEQGCIRIRGDAQGILAALVKRAAKSPLLNEESSQNEWADALSRGQMPRELSHLPRVEHAPELWHEKWEKQ